MGMGWLDDGVLVCFVCNGRKIERIENRFETLRFFIVLSEDIYNLQRQQLPTPLPHCLHPCKILYI
jgi:hypothetical protein